MNIEKEIASIKWENYDTAYGNALEISELLNEVFSIDKIKALNATNKLWGSLCHDHAFISSSALPSYKFLRYALFSLDEYIKVEILDIFFGFARCLKKSHFEDLNREPYLWEIELLELFSEDKNIFENFISNENEDISYFASSILDALNNKATDTKLDIEWSDFPHPFERKSEKMTNSKKNQI